MKKITSVLLAFVLAMGLAGCSSEKGNGGQTVAPGSTAVSRSEFEAVIGEMKNTYTKNTEDICAMAEVYSRWAEEKFNGVYSYTGRCRTEDMLWDSQTASLHVYEEGKVKYMLSAEGGMEWEQLTWSDGKRSSHLSIAENTGNTEPVRAPGCNRGAIADTVCRFVKNLTDVQVLFGNEDISVIGTAENGLPASYIFSMDGINYTETDEAAGYEYHTHIKLCGITEEEMLDTAELAEQLGNVCPDREYTSAAGADADRLLTLLVNKG